MDTDTPPGAGGGEVDGEQEHEQQGTGQYSSWYLNYTIHCKNFQEVAIELEIK